MKHQRTQRRRLLGVEPKTPTLTGNRIAEPDGRDIAIGSESGREWQMCNATNQHLGLRAIAQAMILLSFTEAGLC
jgi:hypothetical protein